MKNLNITSIILAMILFIVAFPVTNVSAYGTGKTGEYTTISNGMAIKKDGTLWAWGYNDNGQLGDGTKTDRNVPVKVLDNVVSVSAGQVHTMAIKSDGSLWAWGANYYGHLGDGTTTNRNTPVRILDNVVSISANSDYTMAIKSDGSLWAWGSTIHGLLFGDGNANVYPTPVRIMDNVVSVCAGFEYTMAIKSDGTLWAWGYNASGQLGDGTFTDRNVPVKVLDNVAFVSAYNNHTMAIKSDGTLWAWGFNGMNELGTETYGGTVNVPVKVLDSVVSVGVGHQYTMAIKEDGTLWAWGMNYDGQLGDGTNEDRKIPVKVLDNVVSVLCAGGGYTMAIKSDGTLWAWGYNGSGQLGDGTFTDSSVPVKVMLDNVRMPGENPPANVTFNSMGGSDVESTSTDIGTKIAPPVSPIRDNYAFAGWYRDITYNQSFDFNKDVITDNTMLYAKWTSTMLTVKLVPNAATEYSEIPVEKGGYITPPSIPTKAGYSFAGWCKNSSLTTPWNFDKDTTNSSTTLYGKWNALPKQKNVTASPSHSKIMVDGKIISFEYYIINGNSYFKLRDIAYVLDGTEKTFSVDWDGFYNAISLKRGNYYSSDGTELKSNSNTKARKGTATQSTIYLDGKVIYLTGYNIDGRNYVKLRDLGVALNFDVAWDAETNTIAINSNNNYSLPE